MSVLKIHQNTTIFTQERFSTAGLGVCGIALHRRDSNDLLVLTYGFYLWFHVPASRNYCPLKIYSSNEERSKSQKTYSTSFLDSAKPRRAQGRQGDARAMSTATKMLGVSARNVSRTMLAFLENDKKRKRIVYVFVPRNSVLY